MSGVWGMILQCGSTIKVRMGIPVSTRHRRDTTEILLKATINPSKQRRQQQLYFGTVLGLIISLEQHIDKKVIRRNN